MFKIAFLCCERILEIISENAVVFFKDEAHFIDWVWSAISDGSVIIFFGRQTNGSWEFLGFEN